jgi:hypothetical protein
MMRILGVAVHAKCDLQIENLQEKGVCSDL